MQAGCFADVRSGKNGPFNRRTFPWGHEDQELVALFAALGAARKTRKALRRGDIRYVKAEGRALAFTRTLEEETVLCAVNAGPSTTTVLTDPDQLVQMGKLLDALDDDDDVQNAWHTLENEEDLDR